MDFKKYQKLQVKKNDRPIKDVLQNYIKQNKIDGGYSNSKLQKIWFEKMGTSINNHTKKIYLAKGKLYVTLDSAPLKHELMMGKSKLIDILNKEMGSNAIVDIYIY